MGTNKKEINVPIWEKYMLTVQEASKYFNICEKRIRFLCEENMGTKYDFTVQNGVKPIINRKKMEHFLDHTTSI